MSAYVAKILRVERENYAKLEKQALQLEEICKRMREALHAKDALLEEISSVACAWAWNLGAGVPPLTDSEIRLILNERIAAEEARHPKEVQ